MWKVAFGTLVIFVDTVKGSENVLAGDESPATEAEDAARSFLARFAQADNPEVFVFVTLIFVMKHKLTNAWFAQADIQRHCC